MFSGRLKAVFRSLRFRLMAWNTAVVILMVIPTLVIVRASQKRALLNEFDKVLNEDAQEVHLAIKQFSPNFRTDTPADGVAKPEWKRLHNFLERKALGHAHSNWFIRLVRTDGKVIYASANATDTTHLEEPLRNAAHAASEGELPLSPSPAHTFEADGDSYRLVQRPLGLPNLEGGSRGGLAPPTPPGGASPPASVLIQIGSSLSGVKDDISLLTRMMVLAGGLILVLAPLGGFWLSGRATAPIAQIIHTTARLRPSHLDERLPLRQSDDELDQLSQTINGLLDRLASFVQEKRDFLANAAHELRSPLAAIGSSVEVALNSERSPQEYAALLEDIMEECGNLGVLVNQLLLLTEGERQPESQSDQAVDLDRVVRRAVSMFEGAAEAEGLDLQISRLDPAVVHGDEHLLQQVINNLLDNALKFTPPPGVVRVEIRADPAEGAALLEVSDTGIGIPAEDLPRVFERFYRGDPSRQRQGARRGSGLGLSICQAVVQGLQGSIKVQSQPGTGTTIQISLPLVISH